MQPKEIPAVLLVPGYTGSGPKHWQTLWQEKHPEYLLVHQRDWNHPVRGEWVNRLDELISAIPGATVLVGHSLGCITIVHWAAEYSANVVGAMLVAPADVERGDAPLPIRDFRPIPLTSLPFPSVLISSHNDPYVSIERARLFAKSWGSRFVDVGPCGHIDTAAGFGPWRQGEVLLEQLRRQTV